MIVPEDGGDIDAILLGIAKGGAHTITAAPETFYDDLPWYPSMKACTLCSCRQEARQVVPGAGVIDAEIMVLGRNPGKDEDRQGFPFVGKGGAELDVWLDKLGLDRGKILVTNLVKCHTSKDRPPTVSEITTCGEAWLRKELAELTKLQVVIPLGAEAAKYLLGDHATSPGKLQAYAERVQLADSGRVLHVLPIAHPAYFLRSTSKKFQLYNSVLPSYKAYLRQEVPDVYERSAKGPV